MPRDRLTRRTLVVSIAVALLAVSTGCLRPSIVRPSVEPISDPPSPVSPAPVARPAPGPSPAGAPIPAPTPASNAATVVPPPLPVTSPTQNPDAPALIERSSLAAPVEPRAAASTQPAVATPVAAPTPLLDAALERVEAINHLDDDPLEVSPGLAKPTDKIPIPSTPAVSQVSTTPAPIAVPIVISPTETPKSTGPTSKIDALETQPKGSIPPNETKIEDPVDSPAQLAEVPSTIPPLEELAPFGVSELHVCRKVHDFGSFEVLNSSTLKSGQRLLIYCELTGLEYEPTDNGFHSRLSSRIEISSADDGSPQWEQNLGPAEDRSGRRRRDCYFNCVIELPKHLSAGNYRLKVTQNDLVGNRSASAEIPLQIVP